MAFLFYWVGDLFRWFGGLFGYRPATRTLVLIKPPAPPHSPGLNLSKPMPTLVATEVHHVAPMVGPDDTYLVVDEDVVDIEIAIASVAVDIVESTIIQDAVDGALQGLGDAISDIVGGWDD